MTNEKMLEIVNQIIKDRLTESELMKVKRQLETDVLKDAAKKAGNLKRQTTALKIVKKCSREEMRGAWLGENGRQYFHTGFSAFELNSPLPLPECKEIFHKVEGMFQAEPDLLELPETEKLVGMIKLQKAEGKKRLYDFGEGRPLVDAELLLDLMVMFPGAECSYNPGKKWGELQFNHSEGRGLLMPVNRLKQ